MKLRIGLEIHCPINVTYKLFCKCRRNEEYCEVCKGEPGTYPLAPKEEVIDKYKKVLLLLKLNPTSNLVFERKHYQYPDLPKGFQITTRREGFLEVPPESKIYFAALEEDPAALKGDSLLKIDYKRCGNPLVELVTNPCFSTEEEVQQFYTQLEKDLEINDIKSKTEPLRVDVNLSIEEEEKIKNLPNPRIEVKNLHSITNILTTITYERERLSKRYTELKETRRDGRITRIRTKEDSDHTRSFTSERKTEYSRPKTSYIFLRELNLPPIKIEITNIKGNTSSYSPVLTYSSITEILQNIAEGLSVEEKEEIIASGLVSFLEGILNRDTDNTLLLRGFISILKYGKLNKYEVDQIRRITELYFKNPVTRETLKRIMIEKSYEEYFSISRKELGLDSLVDEIRPLSTIQEKIEVIVLLEKSYLLPITDIKTILDL